METTWNFSAVNAGIDAFVTSLPCQQVNPAVFRIITVCEKTAGIVAVSIGISEAQDAYAYHLLCSITLLLEKGFVFYLS